MTLPKIEKPLQKKGTELLASEFDFIENDDEAVREFHQNCALKSDPSIKDRLKQKM